MFLILSIVEFWRSAASVVSGSFRLTVRTPVACSFSRKPCLRGFVQFGSSSIVSVPPFEGLPRTSNLHKPLHWSRREIRPKAYTCTTCTHMSSSSILQELDVTASPTK
ncbi:hypothetical protein V8E53_000794 [Lactarius tabidus]